MVSIASVPICNCLKYPTNCLRPHRRLPLIDQIASSSSSTWLKSVWSPSALLCQPWAKMATVEGARARTLGMDTHPHSPSLSLTLPHPHSPSHAQAHANFKPRKLSQHRFDFTLSFMRVVSNKEIKRAPYYDQKVKYQTVQTAWAAIHMKQQIACCPISICAVAIVEVACFCAENTNHKRKTIHLTCRSIQANGQLQINPPSFPKTATCHNWQIWARMDIPKRNPLLSLKRRTCKHDSTSNIWTP